MGLPWVLILLFGALGCRAELLSDPALVAADGAVADAEVTADTPASLEVSADTASTTDTAAPDAVDQEIAEIIEIAGDIETQDAVATDNAPNTDAPPADAAVEDAPPADALLAEVDAVAQEIAGDAEDVAPNDAVDAADSSAKDATPEIAADADAADSIETQGDVQSEVAADGNDDTGPKAVDCAKLNCDDGNVCTLDSCDPVSGCKSGVVGSACLGDSCSKGGCADGVCYLNKKDCNDADACTADFCKNGFCLHTALPCQKPPCNSNADCGNKVCDLVTHTCVMCLTDQKCSPATPICSGGQCTPGTLCSSGLDCKGSSQLCDLATGHCVDCLVPNDCKVKPNQTCLAQVCIDKTACGSDNDCPCAPGVDCSGICAKDLGFCVKCNVDVECGAKYTCGADHACHANVCATGACLSDGFLACNGKGTAYLPSQSCVDKDPCTQDDCDAVKGCVFPAVVGSNPACEDGDVCTTPDQCAAGICKSGAAKLCDDGNPCTVDSCDKIKGC